MSDFLAMAVVFYGIYRIFKEFLDFFLKKKIINSGHVKSAGILNSSSSLENNETQKYPSLKWGLISFFAGIGLVLITVFYYNYDFPNNYSWDRDIKSLLFLGVELTFISLGFLIYFIIVMKSKK